MRTEDTSFVDRLQALARLNHSQTVQSELSGVRVEDLADGLSRLSVEDGLAILRQLDDPVAADILVELPTEIARAYVQELSDTTLALYLDILPMDDALDLREELGPGRFDSLLQAIPTEDAQEIRRLMEYPEDSVGRLFTERFFEVGPSQTMSSILADIRMAPESKYEMVNDLYVLDSGRHLLGVFSLRKAIRADVEERAEAVMNTEVVTCFADEPAEEAARRMSRYGLYALPVLDSRGRMLGIFTGDDAQEVLQDANTEDVLALGGVSGDAESYLSLSVWQLIKRRLPWLGVLFIAEFLTGSVLRRYTGMAEEGGQTVLAQLMLFVPLLIGAGGNSGSQVTTTITRSLAMGEIRPRDAILVLRREFLVAVCIGLVLGSLGYARAMAWGSSWQISAIVGLALPAIIVWATSVGSLLPLGARRLNIDPAVMSAPFIATLVDATGLIIFFEIARRFVVF
jgi:magnesium transporter